MYFLVVVAPLEVPSRELTATIQYQSIMLAQRLWIAGFAVFREIFGAGAKTHVIGHELSRLEAGIFPSIDTDRQIEPISIEIRLLVVQHHLYPDLGIFSKKPW